MTLRVPAADHRSSRDDGYAMVALLVAMSVMAVLSSVVLPMYQTEVRREKESELIFRGEQYARAIALFQRKYGNAAPPTVDALINEKFLRKRYKDPITGEDFQLLTPGMPIPGQDTPPAAAQQGRQGQQGSQGSRDQQGSQAQTSRGGLSTSSSMASRTEQSREELDRQSAALRATGIGGGGIIGVASKSKDKSFRLYNGRDKYNEWVFLGTQQNTRAGGPGGAAGAGGGRGGAPGGGRGAGTPPGGPNRGGRGGMSLPRPTQPPSGSRSSGFSGTSR